MLCHNFIQVNGLFHFGASDLGKSYLICLRDLWWQKWRTMHLSVSVFINLWTCLLSSLTSVVPSPSQWILEEQTTSFSSASWKRKWCHWRDFCSRGIKPFWKRTERLGFASCPVQINQICITVGCLFDVLILKFLTAHRTESRLSVPGVQYESEDEPNGEITQRGYGATAGID